MTPWLGFELRVALRFLREGRMQSLLIIVGVAAGVAITAGPSVGQAGAGQPNHRLAGVAKSPDRLRRVALPH